jgi:hypothetical protein
MVIIETEKEFQKLQRNIEAQESIWIPVFSDSFKHYCNNRISFVYIYLLEDNQDYIISFNHKDCINWKSERLQQLKTNHNIYALNKKSFSYFYPYTVLDIDLMNWFISNDTMPLEDCDTEVHESFNRWYYNVPWINDLIPITRHYERCRSIRQHVQSIMPDIHIDTSFEEYNAIVIDNLAVIERNGLHIDYDKFVEKLSANGIERNTAFTEYNIYTNTGRPSNRFGGVNYGALKKDDGSREAFTSRFERGMLIEFDYDSYHVRIIAELIGHPLPKDSIHEWLGRQYFNTPVLSDEHYEQAKQITFRQLYGGVESQYEHIQFFQDIKSFINKLWIQYQTQGYIQTPIFGRKIKRAWFPDMNANKLFNYYLQATETEQNMIILNNVNEVLQHKTSKLILYTYDSFLFDYDLSDGKDLLLQIRQVLEHDKFPVKIKAGKNFNEMVDYTKKIS